MITKFKIFESFNDDFKIGDYVRYHTWITADKSIFKIIDINPKNTVYGSDRPYKLYDIKDQTVYWANYMHIYLVPDYVVDAEKYNL